MNSIMYFSVGITQFKRDSIQLGGEYLATLDIAVMR